MADLKDILGVPREGLPAEAKPKKAKEPKLVKPKGMSRWVLVAETQGQVLKMRPLGLHGRGGFDGLQLRRCAPQLTAS